MYKTGPKNILSTRFQGGFSTLSTEFSTLRPKIGLYPKYNIHAGCGYCGAQPPPSGAETNKTYHMH
jgi:hypothetical protein